MVKIRLAENTDIDDLIRIERASFELEHYPQNTRQQFAHLINKGNAEVFVLIDDTNLVIGSAVLLYRKNSQMGRLYSIAVDPNFNGKSYGTYFFDCLENHLKNKHRKGLFSEIRGDKTSYKKWYENRGYSVIRILKEYYPDGCDGLKLRKLFNN